MSENYYSTLRRFDDPVRWEEPEGFDYESEQKAFYAAKNHLQSVLGQKLDFKTGSHIQDASYHSMIRLVGDLLKTQEGYAQIRFSNFGKMVSILYEDIIKESVQIDIVQHLTALGYHYIPEGILENQYTGKNAGVAGIDTWWVRYFDWV